MEKSIILILIIHLLSFSSLFGQNDFRNGFIITLDKDTINGQLDYRSNLKSYESCIFKSEQERVEYFPRQIIGFGYTKDKCFSSQIIPGSFVEVLVLGAISLYKSKDMYHLKKDTILLDLKSTKTKVEKDGKVGYMENNFWRGATSYLIFDCLPNSNTLVSKIRLDEKSLSRLIVKYNKCTGTVFTEFKTDKPWTKFNFGASIGIVRSAIQIQNTSDSYAYLDDSYSSIVPSIGVIIDISSPRLTERIAFQGEIHFVKSSYSSLIEINRASTDYYDTYIDLSTLSVPLSLKYSFPEKWCGFYFQAGLNYDYHLNSKATVQSETVNGNVVNTAPESPAFEINDSQIGFWGGIGILKSYNRFKGSLALRYFQMSALNRTAGFTSSSSRFSINLILFK